MGIKETRNGHNRHEWFIKGKPRSWRQHCGVVHNCWVASASYTAKRGRWVKQYEKELAVHPARGFGASKKASRLARKDLRVTLPKHLGMGTKPLLSRLAIYGLLPGPLKNLGWHDGQSVRSRWAGRPQGCHFGL